MIFGSFGSSSIFRRSLLTWLSMLRSNRFAARPLRDIEELVAGQHDVGPVQERRQKEKLAVGEGRDDLLAVQ